MLSVAKIAIGRERYYLATVASDSGAGGLVEPDGVWLGRGAESLGLEGAVEAPALATVIRGVDPSTGEWLSESHRSGRVRVGALDLTFAPPKSVSVLHALGSSEAVAEVRAGHDEAVAEVLGYLEREAAVVRRSLGGSRSVLAADGVVAAGFVHRTSRAPDPHLHTHVLVVNCARGDDGRWTALDGRAVYLHARTAGALYESHLRFELANRLGVSFGPPGRTAADIEGFDAGLLRAFSRRSLEIRTRLEELGLAGPHATRVAAAATRPEKDLAVPYHELVAGWREKAAELGLSSRHLERIAAGGRDRRERWGRAAGGGSSADGGRAADRSWLDAAVDRGGGALGRPGHDGAAAAADVTRRELLRAHAQLERDGTEVLAAEAAVDSALAGDRFVERGELSPRLRASDGRAIPAGIAERRFATAEVVAAERDIVDVARRAELGSAEPAGEASVADSIARRRTALGPSGMVAVERLARSRAPVTVLSAAPRLEGLATDVVDAAVEAWQRSGREVVAVAPARRTALRLESELGLPVSVLAPDGRDAGRDAGGFEVPAGGVVIVVAAERVDARALRRVLTEAETATARAVVWTSLPLGGDPAERTGVLTALAAAAGGPTVIEAGAESSSVRRGRRPALDGAVVASSRRRLGNVEVVVAATAADARAFAFADRDRAQHLVRTTALVVPWRVRRPEAGERRGEGREVPTVAPGATTGLLRQDRTTRLLVIGEATMLPDAAVAAGVDRTHYVTERALAGAADPGGRLAEITEPSLVVSVLGRRPTDALVRRAWLDAAQELVAHDHERRLVAAGELPASVARAEEAAHEAAMRSFVAELRSLRRQRGVDEPRLPSAAEISLSGKGGGREDRSLRQGLGRELSR